MARVAAPVLQLAAQSEAVLTRHDHVEENQLRHVLRGDPQPLLRVRRRKDFVSSRLQHAGQQVDVRGGVVDDENLFSCHGVDP